MLLVLIPSLFVSLSLSEKSCDQCWDEYWSCDWDVQSSAWDKCSAVWEEGSEYAPFDRQCIEQQAEDGIVECYENAGCFEPGNQECWWKMWDLGCSPYKCEAYTICYENTINEQNCDGQLDQCQQNCDDSGYDSYGGYDSFDSYNYYDSFDNYNDYGDSYNFDYYDNYGSYAGNYGYGYYYDEPQEWQYAYEEIPECIRNECGDVLDQCASTDSCVQGIENVANSCYNGYEDAAQCMDDTFINVSNNEGALGLCDGDQLCSNDLQALGECIVSSANYGFCPETDYKALRGVVKLVKGKRSKLLQQQRRKRNALRKRPRSQLRQRRNRRKLAVAPKQQRRRARRGRQERVRRDRRVRPRSQLRQNRQRLRGRDRRQNRRRDAVRARRSRRQLTGYTGGDSWDYQYPSGSYDNHGYTDSWDSYNYDNSWDSYPYDNSWDYSNYDYSWDYDWNSYPDYDYSWDSYDYGDSYEPQTVCGGQEEWEYTYNEIPPCISNNCNVELLTCAADYICVAAIESIAKECDSENDAEIGQCIEDIIVNDVEQAKVNEFCDSDTLCIQSFTSLGQCVLDNRCFAENQYAQKQKKSVVSLVKSAKSLRRQKTDNLKKRENDRQRREKQKRLAFRDRKLNQLKQRERRLQKQKLAQKRREFVARRRVRKSA